MDVSSVGILLKILGLLWVTAQLYFRRVPAPLPALLRRGDQHRMAAEALRIHLWREVHVHRRASPSGKGVKSGAIQIKYSIDTIDIYTKSMYC